MPGRTLIVEGINDKSFYEAFCEKHHVHADIRVSNPRDFSPQRHNTKQGAINLLRSLLKQIADGSIERLAMILDSDQSSDGGGVQNTLKQIQNVLSESATAGETNFETAPTQLASGGMLFKNQDGLADFGLWLMPDNSSEGALENWVISNIASSEKSLYTHAQTIVSKLAPQKFPKIREIKANVATWLAWQTKPGESLYYTIHGNLLDETSASYAGLRTWLGIVFP